MLESPANAKSPDAGRLRDHLESVARQTGHRDERLDAVRLPDGVEYLWSTWLEIRLGGSEGFGGIRLTWRDLADWRAVTGVALDAFEVEAIMAMDAAFRAGAAKERGDA